MEERPAGHVAQEEEPREEDLPARQAAQLAMVGAAAREDADPAAQPAQWDAREAPALPEP